MDEFEVHLVLTVVFAALQQLVSQPQKGVASSGGRRLPAWDPRVVQLVSRAWRDAYRSCEPLLEVVDLHLCYPGGGDPREVTPQDEALLGQGPQGAAESLRAALQRRAPQTQQFQLDLGVPVPEFLLRGGSTALELVHPEEAAAALQGTLALQHAVLATCGAHMRRLRLRMTAGKLIAALPSLLPASPPLEQLELCADQMDWPSEDAEAYHGVLRALPALGGLLRLDLCCSDFAFSLDALLASLPPSLTALGLRNTFFGGSTPDRWTEGWSAPTAGWARLPKLQRLEISGLHSAADMDPLLPLHQHLSMLGALTHLSFQGSHMDYAGAGAALGGLARLRHLETGYAHGLNLGGLASRLSNLTCLRASCCEPLAAGATLDLSPLSQLRRLALEHFGLATAPRGLASGITYLDLWGNEGLRLSGNAGGMAGGLGALEALAELHLPHSAVPLLRPGALRGLASLSRLVLYRSDFQPALVVEGQEALAPLVGRS